MSESGVTLPPPPRKRRTGWILGGVIFLSGMICGAGLSVIVIHRAVRKAVRHPEARGERAAKWLSRQLKLDAGQRERVRELVDEQTAELEGIRAEVWPRVLARLRTTETEIESELDDEQKKKWRKIVAKLHENWLPPEPAVREGAE